MWRQIDGAGIHEIADGHLMVSDGAVDGADMVPSDGTNGAWHDGNGGGAAAGLSGAEDAHS